MPPDVGDREALEARERILREARALAGLEITHRDVKPSNVLVADDGRVKLTDFRIARNASDTPLTSTGLVLGSPAYIAPEVAAGRPVTPAADLWGSGPRSPRWWTAKSRGHAAPGRSSR
ncbi:MAG: protein kinase domain-containing protein [Pseudonocardia sp.]